MAKNASKLSMFGENFEICWSQMSKNTLKLSTIVRENFEIHLAQMAKNCPKLSTMVGNVFEICIPKMAKNSLNIPTWLEKIFKFAYLKWKVFCKNFSLTFPDFPGLFHQNFPNSLIFPDFAEKDTFSPDFQDSMNHARID